MAAGAASVALQAPDQAEGLRALVPRGRVVAVTSGKGGVGKTSLAANLAVCAAGLGKRVVLVDADLGMANVGLVLGMAPRHTLADVLDGRVDIPDAVQRGPGDVGVLLGATGMTSLADLEDGRRLRLLAQLERLERRADLVVVDTGAGISSNVVQFAVAADQVLVVATPEPTSFTCAYAAIKCVSRFREHGRVDLVVNQARNLPEAERTAYRICRTSTTYLELEVRHLGHVLADPRVGMAVRLGVPLVHAFPASAAAIGIRNLTRRLLGLAAPPPAPRAPAHRGVPPATDKGRALQSGVPARPAPDRDGFFQRLARFLR